MHPKFTQHRKHSSPAASVSVGTYVLKFDSGRFYQSWRYHRVIYAKQNPDELVSWGHASTREMAVMAAQNEVEKLEGAPAFPNSTR
jgi:hypothetical protein